nr:MAG TPA: ChiA1-BD-binding domain protein [Caudoviricetes sp.]
MTYTERARELRPYIEKASAALSNNDALKAVELFPVWKTDVHVSVGDRYSYLTKLYKCVQEHTTQSDWTPDLTPALWAVVDAEHGGTIDDPIPASRGMEYEYGKYYSDSEDNHIYLCERQGAQAGDKVVLQYMPHELIGHYFTLAK